jgi:hypothetical protein
MSQTVSAAAPAVSRRMAQFGVALIAVILVACFAILIAARAEARPTADAAAPLVAQ